MNLLQRHGWLRQAIVVAEQLMGAAIIYTIAVLLWRALSGGTGRPGVVTVLLSTAAVAVVLAISRRRFERSVNWLAFGERADVYELASGLLQGLATSLEVDEVLPRLAETAARSVGSRRGEVQVWLADGNTWRQTWPLDASDARADVAVAVHHGGDQVGEMVVSVDAADLSPVDRRLLGELVGPAGLALSTVRLTHALRQQAAEIESTAALIRASRERIVNARRAAQERTRHQLASLVQPHLDAAGCLLQQPGPPDADRLTAASRQVADALDELRTLARGLFPARLYEVGLLEALQAWAEQSARPVSLSSSGNVGRLRQQPEVSAALYFCAVSVLSSATRGQGHDHGPDSRNDEKAAIRLTVAGNDVLLEVRGRLDLAGWQALSDRADAFGGAVETLTDNDAAGNEEKEGVEAFRVRLPLITEATP